MQPDEARTLCKAYVGLLKYEQSLTHKVIAAVPPDKGEYAPHPKSTKALDLAWHIASSELWFLEGVIYGQFKFEERPRPDSIKTGADVAAWYDNEFKPTIAHVEALSGEHLSTNLAFVPGLIEEPMVQYLSFAIRHSVHHRGQLSAYLRPMGAKVPSIYGGSADEPFEMPAQPETATAQA